MPLVYPYAPSQGSKVVAMEGVEVTMAARCGGGDASNRGYSKTL